MKNVTCDVAVIGSGPAGLAAAVAAHDQGAEDVLLIERDAGLGGILQQCIHNGFGLHLFDEDLTGPEYASRFIAEAEARPIRQILRAMVIELNANRELLAVSRNEGLLHVSPKAVVLAMGCRERPRGAIALPGFRPAGIMTAGTAQRFINIEGFLPGKEIVILGSGDIGMIMARRLHLEGARVKAVIEIQSCIGGLSRNLVQCLQDFDIPLYLSHTLTDIHGAHRVEGVDVAPLDRHGKPDLSGSFPVSCDTLLLSVGLIPENELSRQAGVRLDPITGGPLVDQHYQTSVPGVFAAGNVVQVFDLVDHVSTCGTTAGSSAARYAAGEIAAWDDRMCRIEAGKGVRAVVPQRLTADRDADEVHFYLRSGSVMRKATLQLSNGGNESLFTKRFRIVRPPEMIHVAVANGDFIPSKSYAASLRGEIT